MATYLIWEPDAGEDVGCADEVDGIYPKYAAEKWAEKNHAARDHFAEVSLLVLDAASGELHAIEINVVPVPGFESTICKPNQEDMGGLIVRGLMLAAGGDPDAAG